MPRGDVFTVRHEATVSTAITIVQVKAGALYGFEILYASLTQKGSVTSVQEKIALVRKSAGATVTTAVVGTHVFEHEAGHPTPDLALGTTATGVIATGEGTDSEVFWEEGFNALGSGWLYRPTPEERFSFPVGAIIGMKFRTAPASQLWQMTMSIREI